MPDFCVPVCIHCLYCLYLQVVFLHCSLRFCVYLSARPGFIASHVVICLVKKYPHLKIVNYNCLDYCSCLENLCEVAHLPIYKFVKGDITSVLKEEKIDTIMHFAAQTHVDNSFGNSFQFTA